MTAPKQPKLMSAKQKQPNANTAKKRNKALYSPKPLPNGEYAKRGPKPSTLSLAMQAAAHGRSMTQMRRIWQAGGAQVRPIYDEIVRQLALIEEQQKTEKLA